MSRKWFLLALLSVIIIMQGLDAQAQEARARFEMMKLIQKEKLDLVLPGAMRDNKIDMWIHVMQSGINDPMALDLGGQAIWQTASETFETLAFFIFTDRGGDRIERAILGGRGDREIYDIFGSEGDLTQFVAERDPGRIAVNMSNWIPASNGLSYTGYLRLVKLLGDKYADRLISAEHLITDFRVRRVQTEILAFAKACEIQRQIMEEGFRSIIPGVTKREELGWWAIDQLMKNNLTTQPIWLPSTSKNPSAPNISHSEIPRSERGDVYHRGDFLSWDWGIKYLNFGTDYKRKGYILKEGETDIPAGLKLAWERGIQAREIIRKTIKIGRTAGETLKVLARALEDAGYVYTPFTNYGEKDRESINALGDDERSGISIDCHCVGNFGFSQIAEGPSISPFRHRRASLTIQQNNLFAFEFMVHTWVPEWGRRLSINFEDNAIVTEKGVEALYPRNDRIIIIR